MNPELDRSKWKLEDSKQLFKLHRRYTNHWKTIAEHFAGRTDNSIKNQFFSMIRKALRKACKVLGNNSNTGAINKIKPKILANYLALEFEIDLDESGNEKVKVSLRDFVQKFAFSPYRDLISNSTKDDLFVIEKSLNFLFHLNEHYIENKNSKGSVLKTEDDTKAANYDESCIRLPVENCKECEKMKKRGSLSSLKTLTAEDATSNKVDSCLLNIPKLTFMLNEFAASNTSEEDLIKKLINYFETLGNFCVKTVETLALPTKNQNEKFQTINKIAAIKLKPFIEVSKSHAPNELEKQSNREIVDKLEDLCVPNIIGCHNEQTIELGVNSFLEDMKMNRSAVSTNFTTPAKDSSILINMPISSYKDELSNTVNNHLNESKRFIDQISKPKNFPHSLLNLKKLANSDVMIDKRPLGGFVQFIPSNENMIRPDSQNKILLDYDSLCSSKQNGEIEEKLKKLKLA